MKKLLLVIICVGAISAFAIEANLPGLGYQEQGRVVLYSDESGNVLTPHGTLVSAQWDSWREPEFQRRLRDESHLGTLRRIDDAAFTATDRR